MQNHDLNTQAYLEHGGQSYRYYGLRQLPQQPLVQQLPITLKILLENVLRYSTDPQITDSVIRALISQAQGRPEQRSHGEVNFIPSRVLLQDFTGVPVVVDLAAMRDAMDDLGGDPSQINPLQPVDLVIDHSVQVDAFGSSNAFLKNSTIEFERNIERYAFLKWGQKAFDNFRVVPPEMGIVHQVNLEYLASVVFVKDIHGDRWIYPDTVVGTDSHTTMINALGVLGWGVGGIEAEAAMLGQPFSLVIPEVVGFEFTGQLPVGVNATDLVLCVTQMLRKHGVVGKFVEFCGSGLAHLSLADRATIANMAPEYGATCGFFPVDDETLRYLALTGRDKGQIELIRHYCQEQDLWHDPRIQRVYSQTLTLDLSSIEPAIAGPSRPQDRILVKHAKTQFLADLTRILGGNLPALTRSGDHIKHGDVVIAAITSCTNTSNPAVMLGAGILARKAHALGLQVPSWVKTSLAPGSRVVTDYLQKADLLKALETLGFYLVGYGCTTCIGNSGPLPEEISAQIKANTLSVCAVLSGNRNFEARIHPEVRMNYLASPPLVVAYALAGRMDIDFNTEPLGESPQGQRVFLRDIWPSTEEIQDALTIGLGSHMFSENYRHVFEGDAQWQALVVGTETRYRWSEDSTYVKKPPYFEGMTREPGEIQDVMGMRVLAKLGDSVTTDHISPAGSIKLETPAGLYLRSLGVLQADFNSYGARRGNHEVMIRGTFANVRLKNQLAPGTEGGWTCYQPTGEQLTIYDAAIRYQQAGVPLLILAGKEYGSGSSRDWAAKGTALLGVRAVIAESFERIHRSNLVGMGVLPLEFMPGERAESLGLTGQETYRISGLSEVLARVGHSKTNLLVVDVVSQKGDVRHFTVRVRVDTQEEVEYYRHGGILQYVLRQLRKGRGQAGG
jgi:aconitate hydratase